MNLFRTVVALAFAAACVYTVLGYPARYGALTGRSRLFRAAGLFLFDLLISLWIFSTFARYNITRLIGTSVPSLRSCFLRFVPGVMIMCIANVTTTLVAHRRAETSVQQTMREASERARG